MFIRHCYILFIHKTFERLWHKELDITPLLKRNELCISLQVFEDLHTYMQSLKKMNDLNPSIIYPAHGSVISKPSEKIQYFINHRLQREKQILDVLEKTPNTSFTALEIVKSVYGVSKLFYYLILHDDFIYLVHV